MLGETICWQVMEFSSPRKHSSVPLLQFFCLTVTTKFPSLQKIFSSCFQDKKVKLVICSSAGNPLLCLFTSQHKQKKECPLWVWLTQCLLLFRRSLGHLWCWRCSKGEKCCICEPTGRALHLLTGFFPSLFLGVLQQSVKINFRHFLRVFLYPSFCMPN
jgi:hypothetical protein